MPHDPPQAARTEVVPPGGRPRKSSDGRPGGGTQSMPLGSFRGLPTGRPRRGPTGPAIDWGPRQRQGEVPAPSRPSSPRDLCCWATVVLGTLLPLVRSFPRRYRSCFLRQGKSPGEGGTTDGWAQTSQATLGRGWRPPLRVDHGARVKKGTDPKTGKRKRRGACRRCRPVLGQVPGTGRRSPRMVQASWGRGGATGCSRDLP